jgi:hypothetical protein
MMRQIVSSTIEDIEGVLDELAQIKDFEDSALGAGLFAHNAHLFDDHAQVRSFIDTKARIFIVSKL